jgi:hypothetical protein
VGDPICAVERSESAVGLGAAIRRVFRASKKNRSEVKGLREKPVEGSVGKLPNCVLQAQSLLMSKNLNDRILSCNCIRKKAGKVAAIVNIEFIDNVQHPAGH